MREHAAAPRTGVPRAAFANRAPTRKCVEADHSLGERKQLVLAAFKPNVLVDFASDPGRVRDPFVAHRDPDELAVGQRVSRVPLLGLAQLLQQDRVTEDQLRLQVRRCGRAGRARYVGEPDVAARVRGNVAARPAATSADV